MRLRPETGAGLDGPLRERERVLVGIRNGIDTDVWDPMRDPHVPVPFGPDDLSGKERPGGRSCGGSGCPSTAAARSQSP